MDLPSRVLVRKLSSDAIHALKSYRWPGNIRELEDVVELAAWTVVGNVLMNLQDTQARFPAITGALETEDQLFLSSLFGYRIGRVNKQDLE